MLYIKLIVWLYPFIKEIFDNDKNLIFKFKNALYNTLIVGILVVSVISNFYLLNSLFTVSSNYRDLSENTKDYSTTKANLEQLKRANIELDYKLKNIKIVSQQKHEAQPTVVSSNCNNRKIMTRRHTIHAISDHNY